MWRRVKVRVSVRDVLRNVVMVLLILRLAGDMLAPSASDRPEEFPDERPCRPRMRAFFIELQSPAIHLTHIALRGALHAGLSLSASERGNAGTWVDCPCN